MENSWEFRVVGLIVKDLDKSVEMLKSIGADTSRPEQIHDATSFVEEKMYGEPVDPKFKLRIKMVQLGTLTIEIIQPVEGKSVHMDFLNNRGPGLFHLVFSPEDFEKDKARLVDNGAKIIVTAKTPNLAIFDLGETGGNIIMELMQRR